MRDTVAANTPIAVSVSGTAPPPQQDSGASDNGGNAAAGGDDSQNPSVNSRADSGAAAAGGERDDIARAARQLEMDPGGGLCGDFRSRRAVRVAATADVAAGAAGEAVDVPAPAPKATPAPKQRANPAPPSLRQPRAGSTAAGLDREVRGSLDELKDTLFRLELRREAGTITEEDYARERERVQKTLRDLVQG